MLDLFTIFTKGGIVLWYFQGTAAALSLTPAVNALIKTVILQERTGSQFNHGNLTLKYKLDNEHELVFVAAYQNIVQLSYVDKLIDQVSLRFRDKYKNDLVSGPFRMVNFSDDFQNTLSLLEEENRKKSLQPRAMKSFSESRKADKSLVTGKASATLPLPSKDPVSIETPEEVKGDLANGSGSSPKGSPRNLSILKKLKSRDRRNIPDKKPTSKKTIEPAKRIKPDRNWVGDNSVSKKDLDSLDCSNTNGVEATNGNSLGVDYSGEDQGMKDLKPLEDPSDANGGGTSTKTTSGDGGGMFSFFKSLTAGKVVTREGMAPILEKMTEHLIGKNVAADISKKLCESVATKLEGKVISTFTGLQSTIRQSMEESLVQILSPKRRIDILHDVRQASTKGNPYVITFCGVNGVGKSTNLAKVAYWLLQNEYRILIAACDTFRSGAVEQLRTHTQHLSSLNPPRKGDAPSNILLYDRGYGKDAAGVAMEAIHFARQNRYDVVLVDTAGRMQDNEPLMRALAKLIRMNDPDLVLFVGEALVGNEAVDQLMKFNRALVDHSEEGNTKSIDGILLTKFDTIDDKVGAAISMTYTTGQPIVFVGTGQRYTDIKSLNVQAVVSSLLK